MTSSSELNRFGIVVHRLAAFSDDPAGGNPAGVVITDEALSDDLMHRIAAAVGYSETAFLVPVTGDDRRWRVRYFSPVVEILFCGHATIATGVVLAELMGLGSYILDTLAGPVRLATAREGERTMATLTSVEPAVAGAERRLLEPALDAMSLAPADLDPRFRPAVAYAGERHLILPVVSREVLARFSYDFEGLRAVMVTGGLTTVAVMWQQEAARFHARNAFPVGGVIEDAATGAAAAAFGAYLRHEGHMKPPASFEILQGHHMGRPSSLMVTIPADEGGIEVTGTAVLIGQGV